jgi:hypothetical protein
MCFIARTLSLLNSQTSRRLRAPRLSIKRWRLSARLSFGSSVVFWCLVGAARTLPGTVNLSRIKAKRSCRDFRSALVFTVPSPPFQFLKNGGSFLIREPSAEVKLDSEVKLDLSAGSERVKQKIKQGLIAGAPGFYKVL